MDGKKEGRKERKKERKKAATHYEEFLKCLFIPRNKVVAKQITSKCFGFKFEKESIQEKSQVFHIFALNYYILFVCKEIKVLRR